MRKIVFLLVASALLGSARANPWVGIWTLDPARSQLTGPVPRELTIAIAEADAGMLRYTVAGTAADGTAFRETFAGPPDGAPHPVLTQGGPSYQAAFRWTADGVLHGETVDPEGAAKRFTVELSGDGRTLTERRHVKTAAGEFDVILVFRR